jgi:phosphatidylglycerophosphatase A
VAALSATPSIARLIASGLGCGRFPAAPGTVASAAAVVLGAGLLAVSPALLAAGALLAAVAGVWAIRAAEVGDDPGWVVIDEVAGQWIALLALPRPTLPGVVAGFALFRLFDILKPGPVGWLDRRSGPLAVMGDDLVAGALAALVLVVARAFWPWLLD